MISNKSLFIGLLACILLTACSDKFQDMDKFYKEGRYLQASRSAVEGLQNPDLRPKIEEFMSLNGALMMDKALQKGLLLVNRRKDEEGIFYLQEFASILEQLLLLNVPIDQLDGYLDQVEGDLEEAIIRYVEVQYDDGKAAFRNKRFRKAIRLFDRVKKYESSGYKQTDDLSSKAYSFSLRKILLIPAYKPADAVTQVVTDTILGLLGGGAPPDGTLNVSLRIERLDIIDKYNRALLAQLNSHKTPYINIEQGQRYKSLQSHYYINGEIDARVDYDESNRYKNTGTLRFQEGKVWKSRSFGYDVRILRYKVSVSLKGGIFLINNNEQVGSFNTEKSAEAKVKYTENPTNVPVRFNKIEYPYEFQNLRHVNKTINKATIIDKAVERAAEQVSRDILRIVDKDLDPYILQLDY